MKLGRCALARLRWSLCTALLTFLCLLSYRIFVGPVPTLLDLPAWTKFAWKGGVIIAYSRWWDIAIVGVMTYLVVVIVQRLEFTFNRREDWCGFISLVLVLFTGLITGWIYAIIEALASALIAIPTLAMLIILFIAVFLILSLVSYLLKSIFQAIKAAINWLCAKKPALSVPKNQL